VFDFDGTLVNTPLKPQGWKAGWWGRKESLLPPFVPHHTKIKDEGQHLLNEKVAKEYLRARKDPEGFTMMMTGRHWGLRKEVMNIMVGLGLASWEDAWSLTEDSKQFVFISGGKTLEGKLARLDEMLAEMSEVEMIEMWEDRPEHVAAFRHHGTVLKKMRANFDGIMVHEPPDWD